MDFEKVHEVRALLEVHIAGAAAERATEEDLARLRKFDASLEEAALNLGATHLTAIRTITLPYLAPAMVGAAIVAFLMSFENFNTTLMLVGSDAPLTVAMYGRLREGTTPVINAVSLVLILASALLAAGALVASRKG